MNQDDIAKNEPGKVYTKIPLPALNPYPLKDIHRWAKMAYHMARVQVSRRKAQKIKEIMPIEMAAYAERMTFGLWRLLNPPQADKKSPLQEVIELVREEIVPTRWGKFRRDFVYEIKIDFNAICDSDYDQKIVDEVNGWIKDLFTADSSRTRTVRENPRTQRNKIILPYSPRTPRLCGESLPVVSFVLLPETAEDYSSLKNLTIRSGIWMRWTGKPLDFSHYIKSPGSPPLARQMEMSIMVTLLQINK